MNLELIPLSDEEGAKIREKHFNIHPNIRTYVHEGRADGKLMCYSCTEDFGLVQGPHIYVPPENRHHKELLIIKRIFKGLYVPMMRDAGCIALSTNCDQSDRGTTTFMKMVGFEIKHLTVGEMTL